MFIKSTLPILIIFGKFFLFLFGLLLLLFIPFILVSLFFVVYFRFKGFRFKKRSFTNTEKSRSILLRLFIDFPKRFVLDRFQSDPDEFDLYGLCAFQFFHSLLSFIRLLSFRFIIFLHYKDNAFFISYNSFSIICSYSHIGFCY